MKVVVHRILIVFLLSCFQLSAQTTLTLQVSKDVAIGYHDGANTSGNNYGGAIQNAAFVIPSVASSTGSNGNRALIDFNLSSIPAGATILSASLSLYALGPYGSVPGHFGTANASYLQRITQNWGEYTATWNNQPTSVNQNQVTLNQSAGSTQDYLNINVTNMVQDMVDNPGTSFGFLLRLINEVSSNGMVFASKDNSNPAKRPVLVITYKSCPDPLSITINASPSATLCKGSSIQLVAGGALNYTWTVNQQVVSLTGYVTSNPSSNTLYTVYGSDINGCRGTLQLMVNVLPCTRLNQTYGINSDISFYPNPSRGNFLIESPSKEFTFKRIEIIDLGGHIIKTVELPFLESKFEVQNLTIPSGMYFCRILSENISLLIKKVVFID